MENVLHIKPGFKCVFLLNGSFVEKADSVRYDDAEPLYITALPLCAWHLPYTVKILGAEVLSNEQLASVYRLPERHLYVKLSPRYNYVYSVFRREEPCKSGFAEDFFFDVRRGDLNSARKKMTPELGASIDDGSLRTFFDDYTDIIENSLNRNLPDTYFLIDKNDSGILFRFDIKNGLIDDILQI